MKVGDCHRIIWYNWPGWRYTKVCLLLNSRYIWTSLWGNLQNSVWDSGFTSFFHFLVNIFLNKLMEMLENDYFASTLCSWDFLGNITETDASIIERTPIRCNVVIALSMKLINIEKEKMHLQAKNTTSYTLKNVINVHSIMPNFY